MRKHEEVTIEEIWSHTIPCTGDGSKPYKEMDKARKLIKVPKGLQWRWHCEHAHDKGTEWHKSVNSLTKLNKERDDRLEYQYFDIPENDDELIYAQETP